jgi:hypothetical protein
MAGICSRHREFDPNCDLCKADIRDLLPNYDQMVAIAHAAGKVNCAKCGFEFFRTTDYCPLCGKKRIMRDPARIPKVLDAIRQIWEKHPDIRLGQLIVNAVFEEGDDPSPRLFYMEDDQLVEQVKQLSKPSGA